MDPPSSRHSLFTQRRFATTSWSRVIQAANAKDSESSRAALQQLCLQYWYPLYAFVRRRGYDKDEAEDLTQAFFAHLLEHDRLQLTDQSRGRFRTFLLTSLAHFITQQWRAANAQKRGGGVQIMSIDFESADEKFRNEPNHNLTAERLFDRQWALAVLNQALEQLQLEYETSGKGRLFAQLQPMLSQGPQVPYAELARQLDMTEGAVKVAVHRMRQRYRERLRQTIAQTVDEGSTNPASHVDDELRHLFDVFA